ncbi:MAG TPA: hypothetical protein VNX18_20990 [Bryobacteraceae bacterium]|jgi:hypothetical protein|nr:hypothetical protein [Bryobacteraceae bacterium]
MVSLWKIRLRCCALALSISCLATGIPYGFSWFVDNYQMPQQVVDRINDALGFTLLLPGLLITFFKGGVHGGSETVMVVANLVSWSVIVYGVCMRRSRKRRQVRAASSV